MFYHELKKVLKLILVYILWNLLHDIPMWLAELCVTHVANNIAICAENIPRHHNNDIKITLNL